MNEKIKRLAEQSEVYVEEDLLFADILNARNEKFAELIVKECLEIIENADDPDFSVWKIKKDFGIE